MYGDVDFIHGRMSFFSDGDDVLREQPLYIDNNWNEGIATGQRLFADAFRHQGAIAMGVRGLYNREFLLKNELFFVEKTVRGQKMRNGRRECFRRQKKLLETIMHITVIERDAEIRKVQNCLTFKQGWLRLIYTKIGIR